MSQQIVRADSASLSWPATLPWPAAMPWLVGAGVYALLALHAGQLLNDPDSYWHVAVGRWIVEHGAVPHVDPFSHTMPGAHWIAFEWLSEVLYAAAFDLAGWPGVALLAAAAIALAFALLARLLLRELPPAPTLVLTMAALLLAAPHMLARPHVLVFPVMVAWAGALVRAMDERRRPPYAALPLLILWANLHGSVALGVALVGPAALEALVQGRRSEWPGILARWLLFGLLAVAAASATPYGPGTLLMPLTTFGLGDALAIIVEWRPQDFSKFGAFELVLLLVIFALSRGMTLPPVRVLVLLGLIHLAISQARHADLLALLAPLFIARPLAQRLGSPHEARATAPSAVARGVVAALAIAVVAAASGTALLRAAAPDPRNTPRAAVVAAALDRAGPVLNDYNFGGYLIYAGIRPFIDGRGELYGRQLMLRHYRAMTLQDLPDLPKLLDDYHIGATLLSPTTPAVALLDRLPGWERVYADDVAVVHRRHAAVSAR
jgi:hypothetical protein